MKVASCDQPSELSINTNTEAPLLHDPEILRILFWRSLKQLWLPVRLLRDYFGVRVGSYFTFLDVYTRNLVIPAAFSTVLALLRWGSRPSTAARVVARICISWWSLRLASHISSQTIEPEPPALNISNQRVLSEEKDKPPARSLARLAASFIATSTVGCIVAGMILVSLNCQGYVNSSRSVFAVSALQRMAATGGVFDASHPLKGLIPLAIHSLSMNYCNKGWAMVANSLSEWDGTGTSGAIIKRLVLEAIDGFMPIWWLAVVRQDREGLADEMQGLYICDQVRRMMIESVLPYMLISPSAGGKVRSILSPRPSARRPSQGSKMLMQMSARSQPALDWPCNGSFLLATGDELMELDEYEDFDDWLEMLLQFAYISWLGHDALYMLPASLISNMFEARSDVFKLCCCVQRPQEEPKPVVARDVATWHGTMRLIAYLSVFMNGADVVRLLVRADAAPDPSIIFPTKAAFKAIVSSMNVRNFWLYANPKRLGRVFRSRRAARFLLKFMRRFW